MKFSPVLRLINNQTLDALRKKISISIAEAPQYIDAIKVQQKKIMYDRITHLNKWYTKIIGLDELKVYQDRVAQLQDQLLNTQEKRREVGRQLSQVREKSIQLQNEIQKVKRQEEYTKFLELMTEETELLKLEKSISTTFQDYDQMERELLTAFTNAIRDSQEKQRAQAEYTKYFGLILSIAGSFLAFVYTTAKKQDIKKFIEEKMSSSPNKIEIDLKKDPVILNLIQNNKTVIEEMKHHRKILSEVAVTIKSDRLRNNKPIYTAVQEIDNQHEIEVLNSRVKVLSILLLICFCGWVGSR